MNHVLRVAQTAVMGIEIGKDVTLGKGVYFVHSLGIVIGGDARIGDRVRFYGNNTVGTAKDNGYPVIEDDVWIGAGARILGPVRIGARSRIGANAWCSRTCRRTAWRWASPRASSRARTWTRSRCNVAC